MAYNTDIERLNYYEGEFLGAVDFQAEQEYYLEMRRRHNLGQHTWGIVTGLDLAQAPNGGTDGSTAEVDVYLQPGMAVDGFGREIVVLSQFQLTQEMFAAFYNPSNNVSPVWVYVWISYREALLNPPADACTAMNSSNEFGRIQETYTLTATVAGAPPVNSMIVVDGVQTPPPSAPSSSSSSSSSSSPTPPDPPPITLPYDDSIPFQEFPTDDSTLIWWIPLGRVLWDPHNEVFLQISTDPVKAAASAGLGREYVGNVSATTYAPAGTYTIVDRNSPYPAQPSTSDSNLGGVQAEVAGSLQVDFLLNAQANALIGGAYDTNEAVPLSPLTIVASLQSVNPDQQLIQFRDPTQTETWYINQLFDGTTPGLNFGEVTAAGNDVDNRIFIQPTQTSSSLPSTQNVGIGTSTPRNPLAIRGQGSWWELLSFEDNTGSTKWHMNHNPQGKDSAGNAYTPGLNFCETQANANFRLFLEAGGNVGIGTGAPQQNLSVSEGLNIDQDDANAGTLTTGACPALTFGSGSGEGIASCRTGDTNNHGLDFYTGYNSRMSITHSGNVGIGTTSPGSTLDVRGNIATNSVFGFSSVQQSSSPYGVYISAPLSETLGLFTSGAQQVTIDSSGNVGVGTQTPQQNLSVNGGLNIDQGNQNTGSGLNPGLSFGSNSGEGIASQRTGTNQYGLNFYTGSQLRMTIASNANYGGVSITGSLTVGGDVAVNGNRTYLTGVDGAGLHWIMAGGTIEGTDNVIGFLPSTRTVTIGSNWTLDVNNINVAGSMNGTKVGYVADRFINRDGIKLERGDVVVLHPTPITQFYGTNELVPLVEVRLSDSSLDPCVCGIVDDPALPDAKIRDLNRAKLGQVDVGLMVTLGAYAYCKVDADIAPISPGDRLTTSHTPGYAQKLDPYEPAHPGTVIGKAMGSLESGKGLIPVFVSHQ